MKNEDKICYEIFINNSQFTCIFLGNNVEKNIPKILGIPDLEFIEKKVKSDITKMYYRENNLVKIKINIDGKIEYENYYPLYISLKRMRQLLIKKFMDNYYFTFNGSIIQKQEEYQFDLKNVIKNNVLYLRTFSEFIFYNEEDLKKDEHNFIDFNDNISSLKSSEKIVSKNEKNFFTTK